MATMQIKSMDDQLYNALKIKAKADNRSLSQQVIMVLKEYLSKPDSKLQQQTEAFLKLSGSWKDDRHTRKIIMDVAVIVDGELNSNYKLFLFGSRAKGLHHEKSDIDIGIISDTPITAKQMLMIQEKIEHIPTLLKIDFVDFNSLGDEFKKIALKHTQEIML